MAQLKSSVVQGSLRVTDTTYTTDLNLASADINLAILTDENKNLVTGVVPVSAGGTGNTSFTQDRLIYSNTATQLSSTTITSDGTYLGAISYLSVNQNHQTDYRLYVNGASYISENLYVNSNIESTTGNIQAISGHLFAGTYAANTEQSSEYQVVAQSGAGKIYLYSQAAITGDRGLYGLNAAGTATYILAVDQNNLISSLATIKTSIITNPGTDSGILKTIYNGTTYNTIRNHNNGNISISAAGAGLYVGYENTPVTHIYYSSDTSSRTEFFQINSDGSYALTRFGVNGQNTSYNLYVNGNSYLDSTTASSTTNLSGQLIVSNSSGGNAAIELWRNSNASWQIANEGGTLFIRNNWTTAKQATYIQSSMAIDYNTGNTAIAGSLAVGQITRNTSYKLYVNGNSYFNGNTTHNGIDYFANGTTYYIDNSAVAYLNDLRSDKVRLVDDWIGFYQTANASDYRYGYIQANANRMYFRKENGVSTYGFDFNSHLYTTGNYYASNNGPHLLLAVSDLTNVKAANNGLSANREQGMSCYSKDYGSWMGDFAQGYTQSNGQIWSRVYLRNYKTDGTAVNNYIYLYANKDGTTSYAIANQSAFRSAISTPSTTGSGASGTWGISITGNAATATKATQDGSGNVITSKYVTIDTAQTITGTKSWGASGAGGQLNGAATDGGINSIRVGNDVWLGDCNAGGIMGIKSTGANTGFYFYNSSSTQTGQFYTNGTNFVCNKPISRGGVSKSWINGRDNAIIRTTSYSGYDAIASMKTTNGAWEIGVYTSNRMYFTYTPDTQYSSGTNSGYTQIYITNAAVLMGAAWNDYAEYREATCHEAGKVVQENDNGCLTCANKRLIPGASVISDTFGYAEGQTEKADTPIAVSGRVLVYPYRDRYEYHAGMAVCSAPNGTVDIMTREEIMMYPDCIIGIVSEIPEYETWGTGNVEVNGRIWIKVK